MVTRIKMEFNARNIIMRPLILWCTLTAFAATGGFAQSSLWERDFILALQKGKQQAIRNTGGLGYSLSESAVLEQAIARAMKQQAPPCDAMKIAVDLKYSPYEVIRQIFRHGGELDLDQVCLCATEKGIQKPIIARAAVDAATPDGASAFERDEVAQSQCLRETGLGYTLAMIPMERIPPPPPPLPPISISAPTVSTPAEPGGQKQ